MRNPLANINPSVIDEPISRRYFEIIKGALEELSRSTAKIIPAGNNPSGVNGDPNFNAGNYLYLPGRTGGQTLRSGGFTILSDQGVNPIFTVSSGDGSDRVRFEPGNDLASYSSDTLFYPSGGAGVAIRNQAGGASGRLSIGVAPSGASASLDIRGEAGAAAVLQGIIGVGGTGPVITGNCGAQGTFSVTSSARMTLVSGASQTAGDMCLIQNAGSIASIPLAVQGKTSQSGNLQEWRDGTGAVLSSITSTGQFSGPFAGSGTVTVADNLFNVVDGAAPTKIAQFKCDSITAGVTRTFTFPDVTGTLPTLENAHTVLGNWTFSNGNTTKLGLPGGGDSIIVGVNDAASYSGNGFILDDGSGFKGEISCNVAMTGNRSWSLPDSDGVILVSPISLTATALSNTASSGFSFRDNTTNTKRLRFVLSGAVGNNNIVVSSTAARAYTLPNDDMTVVGQVGSSALTGQTASVGATTLRTTTHAGVYRISIYAVFTAVTVPGNLTLTALWTDPQQAQTLTVNRGGSIAYTAVGSIEEGSVTVRATSGTTIQFSTTQTGTGTYNVYATCEVVTNS